MSENPVAGACRITCCGEQLILTAQRVLLWPRQAAALVADWHIGKAAVFGRRGLAVPAGTEADDFKRLDAVIEAGAVRHLYVLGDLMHAPPQADDSWPTTMVAWLARHAALQCTVIAGNHDRVAADHLPAALRDRLDWHANALRVGPFLLAHEPYECPDAFVLAGHLHPTLRLMTAGDRVRAPVYWFRASQAVLPAFGGLTGGMNIRPAAGERVYLVGPDIVSEVAVR